MTVRDAARFLGVSPQTVYLWVERKQIPHLRVMGRNIRFLKSDLEPFRASFQTRGGEWQDRVNMMASCIGERDRSSGGCATGTETGKRRQESTGTADWKEAQQKLRERLQARDDNILEIVRKGEQLTFEEWADFSWRTIPSRRCARRRRTRPIKRAVKHLNRAFGPRKLAELSADVIEEYLRHRLRQRVRRKTRAGVIEKGVLKPSTVHQEFRVLRRMLNVAVRKKLLPANPCSGVEFPVAVKGLFRPHYMAWSEQQRIEAQAPEYLRNVDPDHHGDRACGSTRN